ncbi:uncharacterized protein LOC122258825 [Penaeus japonicus]|uniref:uncharacterized protein LOC122258825 n=1 Tax=Penaeus japonicus TaxID=27405 RepID=UPI001C7142FF|nr:uncharacterized protein LOC122258825 [Penaeus japonicus]
MDVVLGFMVVLAACVGVHTQSLPPMDLMHRAFLDQEGKYLMLWTPREQDIVIEVQVETKGYVGLGFSPNGGMRDADIVLGWVTDDGKVVLEDRFATGYREPKKDNLQDVELLGGSENETHTVLRFSRPWSTCDDEDYDLSGDTVRLIWAYGNDDPGEGAVRMHDERGTKSMYLQEPQFALPDFGDDVKEFDLISANISLPNDLRTLYWCRLFKMPNITQKTHIIGYVPFIQEGNHKYVHHIVLYECHLEDSARHFEKWLDVKGAQCHSANMPLSWKRCTNPIIAWAVGGEGEMLPDHVGFPMGEEHGGSTYYLMEMHYDNPNLQADVVDASGVKIFYTENLREHEAGSLVIGHGIFNHIIPPKTSNWLSVGHCSSDCTSQMVPADGIKVVQGLLHSHLLGRELYLRQIRDGRELPMVFSDASYDFNYQQTRVLKEEMTILPGDSFITECVYDSSERSGPSFGGFGTDEEMCLGYLTYYPRTNLSLCTSSPAMDVILESFGVEEIYNKQKVMDMFAQSAKLDEEEESRLAQEMKNDNYTAKVTSIEISKMLMALVAKSPEKYLNTSLYDILHDKATWENKALVEQFQKEAQFGDYSPHCLGSDFKEKLPKDKRGNQAYPSFIAFEQTKSCGALEEEPTQTVNLNENNNDDKKDTDKNSKDTAEGMDETTESMGDSKDGMRENGKMMHRAVLDQRGDYVMLWTPQENNIIFEVQAATKGYVGLGFSPNGGMTGSDIVLGWVTDEGEVMLQDRYATGYMMPEVDETQDVELLGGFQNDTHTVLRFSRLWNTCDERDYELTGDTVRLIWAIGDNDPVDEDSVRMHDKRGTKSMYLKEPQFELPTFSEDVQHWDVLSPNVTIPSNLTTLYWCKLFKIPPITRKTHVIGYVPVIQEGNHQHVHHILLYECHIEDSARHYEKWLDVRGAQCFGANMPLSWRKCTAPLVAWAIGGDGELMPENVGLPIGEEHGGATYFMMEIHYDNPNKKAGVVDGSGIRIFHTDKLREYDAGIMMIGHVVSPLQLVPPNEQWLSVGTCDSSCTDRELPDEGIKVFQGLLHSHLLGKGISVRQIRDGKELPMQLKDSNYDFNYQQIRKLKDEMTIFRGDSLITECQYDATKRNVPTFGGFGTEEEMCLVFLTYYPRVDLSVCASQPTLDEVLSGVNVEDIYNKEQVMKALAEEGNKLDEEAETKMAEDMQKEGYEPKLGPVEISFLLRMMVAKAPEKYNNISLYDILHDKETWQTDTVAKLQDNVAQGDHVSICQQRSDNDRSLFGSQEIITYPDFEVFKPDLGPCESQNQAESANSLPGAGLMHRAVLDREGQYVMLWTPGDEDIVFEVQAETKGYVGLGFSPNGGMTGSDIVLGWVTDDGEVMLQDSYATGYTEPKKDDKQDVKLLGGYQNDSHTVLRFSRPWSSCDEEDFELSSDTVRIIWAIGSEDPTDNSIKRHDKRGTKSLFLKEPQFVLPTFGEDVKAWDVLSPNVTLPSNITTLYWCKLVKMPPITRKTHVIGFVPIIQEGNHQHVHHILLYECQLEDSARHYEKWLDVRGAQCFGANMPLSWRKCSAPLVAWAIGGDGEILPDNVGFPLGEEHGGATYFMMEIHYDNPDLKEGVVDASGLRIFHTENLREYDAGILILGHSVSPLQIIPPKKKWLSVGHCDSGCTKEQLPDGGIKVFQGVLHAHLLGRELYLRQIRDGKELPMELKDAKYDFNYQQTRMLKELMTILPGDALITECQYDASKRNVPTFGGFGTEEEMCLAFLSYYPRVNLSSCVSQPHLDEILDGLDVEEAVNKDQLIKMLLSEGELDEAEETELAEAMQQENHTPLIKKLDMSQVLRLVTVKSPEKYANMSLYDILHDEKTWQEGVVNHLQREVERGEHLGFCTASNDGRNLLAPKEIKYPKFEALRPEVTKCGAEDQAKPSGTVGSLPPMDLMHRAVMDQEEAYVMLWTPREKDVVFEVQVKTAGYVGLGFSPNGGMKGADIVLGWVTDEGEVMLQDRYATGYTMPTKDSSQDVELLGGYQNDTHTVLRFSKPLDSCDTEEDRKLSSDTIRIIWAYGYEDPKDEDQIRIHDERGTKSMYLMEPQFVLPTFGEDVQAWEILSPNVSLPDDLSTLYWCKLYKMPRLTQKNHVIGYVPIVQKGNEKHVHHILLYECYMEDSARHYEKWLDVQGAQCYGPNMPVSWNRCSTPIVTWAIGSDGEMLPDRAGFPMGEEHGGATYLMMEIHYDNPKMKKGVVDSSGLRIFHTEKLREYDAGILTLGHSVSHLELIPPNMNWLTTGYCSADCLGDRLPKDGVKVFQGVLHAHLLGREINLRHIRDGRELPPVFRDNSYDFNYQQARILQDEMSILPGDSFITECRYNSMKRRIPTFGGFGTEEEMCLAFLSYYPRFNLSKCVSSPNLETILETLGIEDINNRDAILKNRTNEWKIEGRANINEEADNSQFEDLKNQEKPSYIDLEIAQLFRGIIVKSPEKNKYDSGNFES